MLREKTIFALALSGIASALWPAPNQIFQGSQLVRLSPEFNITFASSLQTSAPRDLQAAVVETLRRVHEDVHHPLVLDQGRSLRSSVIDAPELSSLELRLSQGSTEWLKQTIRATKWGESLLAPILSIAQEAVRPLDDRDESYSLYVPADPVSRRRAFIVASTTLGLLRGLQTFSQLVYAIPALDVSQGDVTPYGTADESVHPLKYITGPVSIKDEPAYPYRGVMLDTSRNFYPVDALKRTIDAMSWAKLNTLHWCAFQTMLSPYCKY